MIDLNEAETPPSGAVISLLDSEGGKKNQATVLIEIGSNFELFHCPNKEGYAQVGKQVLLIRSREFKETISHRFFELTGKGCNDRAVRDALATLESIAKYDRPKHSVYNRVANLKSKVYLDIGCDDFRVIEITAEGWQILNDPPVKFARKRGMAALPDPTKGGGIEILWQYLNLNKSQLPLVFGFIFCSLAGIKPYPVLVLQGEQGSGKSTTSRVIRSLIDPSTVPLRTPPKDPRDLVVSAMNSHCVVLDNLSGISPEISDCLCRLSTGGGMDLRALYTDSEQILVDVQKPVMVNGIDDIATRPDLAQRALILNLIEIPDESRKDESAFWAAFDQDKCGIFCGFVDAIAAGLRHIGTTELATKPRMADAALWITACEKGFCPENTFIEAHTKNQAEAIELGIEASPIGAAIMGLMTDRETWKGTPTELLKALGDIAGENQSRSKAWPQSPKGMKNAIRRLKPGFRRLRIDINDDYRIGAARLYSITAIPKAEIYPSYLSQVSLNNNFNDLENEPVTLMTDSVTVVTDNDSMCHRRNTVTAQVMTDMTLMTDRNQNRKNTGVNEVEI